MQATFAIGTDPATLVDEAALQSAGADGSATGDEPILMGRVTVSDDGAQILPFDDDLQFLVPNLCLRAVRSLARESRADVIMASWPRRYALVRDGETVRVLEDGETELARFPYAPLVKALQDCAARFTAWLAQLASVAPEWQPLLHLLERERADVGHEKGEQGV